MTSATMRRSSSFQPVWRAAVIVCTVLAVFVTVFVSCSPGAKDDALPDPDTRQETTAQPAETP